MKKRLISLLLAMVMLLGCSVAFAEADDPLGLAAYVTESTGGYVSDFKLAEPVKITSVDSVGETLWYEEGMDAEYNEWMMQWLVELGVDIDYDWVVTSGEYTNKLNLSIASGNIPDVFRCNSNQLVELVEAGLVMDITDIYEANISDFARKAIEDDPTALPSATFDGRLFAIPQPASPQIDGGDSMYFRTDWLADLGKEVPTTEAELMELMYAFSNDDPDKNGVDDTFGFYLDNDIYAVTLFAAMYDQYPQIWTMAEDGTVQWGGVADGMKDVLKKLNKLYADGIIDPEFTIKDGTAAGEDIGAGKHGLMFGSWITGYGTMMYSVANDADADWEAYTVVSADAEPAKVHCPFPNHTYYVISAECDKPEVVIAMVNYALERYYDDCLELIEPLLDPALHGSMHDYIFMNMEPANKNMHITLRIRESLETGDESILWPDDKVNYASQCKFYEDHNPTSFSHKVTFAPYKSGLANVDQYITEGRFVDDVYTGIKTESMIEYNGTLDALQQEYYVKMIAGGDVDALWDEFVSTWYASGGDLVTADVNEWYAAK